MFFLAGLETSSTLLTYLTFELALNEDIQTKLYKAISEVANKQFEKKISYDVLQSMKYLGCVVSETLRKWPPALLMDRLCTKDYMLEFDDKKIIIKKGQLVWIPIYGLHMNPEYFQNPMKFDPERFNEKHIDNIQHGSYISFGAGPRSCIGSRFALMQVKSILYYLLKEFSFEICEKTNLPIKIGMLKRQGVHLELRKRDS